MSIMIKGMRMPTSCYDCNCFIRDSDGSDYCCLLMLDIEDNDKRDDDCPLVPVPPNGRLIDSTIIERAMTKACNECRESCIEFDGFYADCENCIFCDVVKALHDAPTIITAEESEDG